MIVERGPVVSGSTSATTIVPRMAAVAFGVTISTESPARIRSLMTLTAARPDITATVDTPGISVIFTIERSRTVSSALPPRRMRAIDASPVTTSSRR